jgi:hypothetical protein
MEMPRRYLRIVKWLGLTPAIGVCVACGKEFKVPLTLLCKTADAKTSLDEQFYRHKCQREDTSRAS